MPHSNEVGASESGKPHIGLEKVRRLKDAKRVRRKYGDSKIVEVVANERHLGKDRTSGEISEECNVTPKVVFVPFRFSPFRSVSFRFIPFLSVSFRFVVCIHPSQPIRSSEK